MTRSNPLLFPVKAAVGLSVSISGTRVDLSPVSLVNQWCGFFRAVSSGARRLQVSYRPVGNPELIRTHLDPSILALEVVRVDTPDAPWGSTPERTGVKSSYALPAALR